MITDVYYRFISSQRSIKINFTLLPFISFAAVWSRSRHLSSYRQPQKLHTKIIVNGKKKSSSSSSHKSLLNASEQQQHRRV